MPGLHEGKGRPNRKFEGPENLPFAVTLETLGADSGASEELEELLVLLGFDGVLDIGTLDVDDVGDYDFGGLDAFSFAPFDIGHNLP